MSIKIKLHRYAHGACKQLVMGESLRLTSTQQEENARRKMDENNGIEALRPCNSPDQNKFAPFLVDEKESFDSYFSQNVLSRMIRLDSCGSWLPARLVDHRQLVQVR